jgi:uncharacterized protein (DUF433 family)
MESLIQKESPMSAIVQVDWSECSLVTVHPEIQSGAPVLKGTRVPVSAIVDNAEDGLSPEEIVEQFPVTLGQVKAVLAYADEHRIADPIR